MRKKTSNLRYLALKNRPGLTLLELLIGSTIILAVILATLSLYMRSNRVSVDQLQFSELQHDVRAAMFFISRDIKSIGAGIPEEFAGYFIQGINNDPNQSSAPVQTDRLALLGNSDPLRLVINVFDPLSPGTITLDPNEFSLYPYTENAYPADPKGYVNRTIIILPNPEENSSNGELGRITSVDFATDQISYSTINVSLPNGLVSGGDAAQYQGGTVHFIELKTYWLDVDGNYPGLTVGTDGYLGQPGILYISRWNSLINGYEHQPLVQNIEDLQFQYHGDLDDDQQLDDYNSSGTIDGNDFLNWDDDYGAITDWTNNSTVVDGIRCLKIWILGRTERAYVSLSGTTPDEVKYVYGKPSIADSPAGAQPDKHRRFLLESTANVRNMSLSIYNAGN
ncbi:MAG: hypothetical protein GTO17_08250 [Candidatus Aminicenantes bacterium]|nr:hypothetical protein [Candidatus Aminicenantes bacterium]